MGLRVIRFGGEEEDHGEQGRASERTDVTQQQQPKRESCDAYTKSGGVLSRINEQKEERLCDVHETRTQREK